MGFQSDSALKSSSTRKEMQDTQVWFLGWEDPLEEGMAMHSSILAWRIPWTEEPGRLRSMGLQSWTRPKQLSTEYRAGNLPPLKTWLYTISIEILL